MRIVERTPILVMVSFARPGYSFLGSHKIAYGQVLLPHVQSDGMSTTDGARIDAVEGATLPRVPSAGRSRTT